MTRVFLPAILLFAMAMRGVAADRGQLDASPSLFTVLAAINAVGYDAEVSSPSNSPLRDAVRKELAARKIPCLPEVKAFFETHKQRGATAELSQYISFALAVTGPPEFAFKTRTVEVPPDVIPLEGFRALMARFYEEANIDDLWQRAQPAFDQIIARYHEPVLQAVFEVNSYLRNSTSGYLGRRFQIYIDLLGAPNQIQTRSFGDDYYVVLTPSPEPQTIDVRHAYLHYLLDPLSVKYGVDVEKKRGVIDYAQKAPALEEVYKSDFLLLATESLIKAIEARLNRKPDQVQQALREGYVLAPFFAEYLPVYEKQLQAMRLHFPDMIKAIDLKREGARLENAEFAPKAAVRTAKSSGVDRQPELTGAAKTLEEAEQFYDNKDWEKSRKTFLKVLEQTDAQALHARSYYGLARIAIIQKDPELGERLFQKSLEATPDPQTKAWTLVYLGRLADAQGDREAATKNYQNALAVPGISEKARRAAEQGIQQSFKR